MCLFAVTDQRLPLSDAASNGTASTLDHWAQLAEESEGSRAWHRLRRATGSPEVARRLLLALTGERDHLYRKWQGPHWTLYSLAEIGFPAGDELCQRVMD